MKYRLAIFIFLLLPSFLSAEEARVVSFKHTLRWLTESNFPNYFQDPQVLDSIQKDITEDLQLKLNVSGVTFPGRVEFKFIPMFGKYKDEMLKTSKSTGYMIDLFSILTRENFGLEVNWTVTMIIRKEGKVILQKEATRVIENMNAAGYMTPQCWWSADQFRETFRSLTREAMELEKVNPSKVIVGALGKKEEEVVSWFPNANKDVLILRGALESGDNTSAQLMQAGDTLLQFVLKRKLPKSIQTDKSNPSVGDFFKDAIGMEIYGKIVEKERRRALLEANQGAPLLIQMDWIEENTVSSKHGEIGSQIIVPMIGVFYEDKQMVGQFVYQMISAPKNYSYDFLYRPAVMHQVKGILHDHEFTAEYNELIGQAEIKMDSTTLAVMIFQNWNPANINAYMGSRISENKKSISSTVSAIGSPKLEKEDKQEWYTVFVKAGATTQEQLNSIQILVSLFFSIGVDQDANSEEWPDDTD